MGNTHYDLAAWIDFARGLGSAPARATMALHAEGCERCADTTRSIVTVGAALAADEAAEPPPDVLQMARAVFSRFQPASVIRLPRLLARLVQDGLAQPLPVGVRGHGRATRWVRYEAAEVLVHLRLDERPGRSAVTLAGQLLEPGSFAAPMSRRPVVITSGRRVLAATSTNRHGEFLVDCAPAGQMRLHIPVDGCTRRVEIALDTLVTGPRPRAATVRARAAGRGPGDAAPTTD
jgi:hypothetical protein